MPWHDDAFLLLPGDGCLLIDTDGVVVHADRFAKALVPDCPDVGDALLETWQESSALIAIHGDAILASGPVDVSLVRTGVVIHARLFRTDSGWGIGILAPHADRVGSGPSFALYARVLRAVNETVMVTTAEPFDAPGPIIVYVNDAFVRNCGYQRHEVLGRSPRIMQSGTTTRESRSDFRHILDAWGTGTVEMRNVHKDGTEFWVSIDVAPVADASGWFTHWVSVQTDVTARKADEADREARRLMVQAILDSLPSQSALLDRQGAIVATNTPWSRVWQTLGDGPEPDWPRVNYLEVCRRAAESGMAGAEDAAATEAGLAAVLAGERDSFALDYQFGVAGAEQWFHLEVRPLRGREGAIVTHVDITRRRRAEEELGYQAMHDPLTGLANREALQQRLEHLLLAGALAPFALILVDLDGFKTVNDAYGHAHGDLLLSTVAQRLQRVFGEDDLIARLGGDEFAVVVTDIGDDWDPARVCEGIHRCLADPIELDIATVRLSGSIGVVMAPPHEGDANAILRDADTAMYVSKEGGRDRWTLFRAEQREMARARAISTDRLQTAMRHGEFELWFQPFVDMSTGRTVASEALLRWRHPVEGVLPPAAFLAAIEAGPLIEDVGEWVLDQALATQARWQRVGGFEGHVMSVNVSPRQLGRGRLPRVVLAGLEKHGVEPANLELEVLESDLLTADEKVEGELRELHDLGVGIAIDDFGTGYSALAYLQTFPVDAVKIDRVFVHRSDTPRGARLLRAAAELSRAVEAISVAEGIETPAQLAAAQAAGISWGQGFLFAKPAPAGDEPVRAERILFG